jgi:hypothetical protein
MDTSVVIPALYMVTGRNTSGADKNLWHYIDWSAVTRAVKSLQVRLAKAVQNKKWRKVKSLQWLVNHSLAAKLLSVKRVTENTGKRTSGIRIGYFLTQTKHQRKKSIFFKHLQSP